MGVAPLLIIAIGNPSRGDDALGPALLELLDAEGVQADGTVELLTDFQLQVEHALDLAERSAVLFVDAAWPGPAGTAGTAGTAGATAEGVTLTAITADAAAPLSSHALRPQAVLQVCGALKLVVPPAWQLAIVGSSFGLGEPLSETARTRLLQALAMARQWVHANAGPAPPRATGVA